MKLSQLAIGRPVTTLMAITCIIALGAVSLTFLPLEFLPEFSSSHVHISIPYASSSPEEVERLITLPVEDVMGTLNHLERISSTSSSSGSNIGVEFERGTNMDLASMEVRDKLDFVRKELPEDVSYIRIRRFQSTDIAFLRLSVSWDGSRDDLYDIVEDVISPRVQRIEGVADVDIWGVERRTLNVEVDQEKLLSHRMSMSALRGEIGANNVDLPGGYVIDGGRKYSVRSLGSFRSVSDIADMPVKDVYLRLKDVAKVTYDYPERTSYSRLNGQDAVRMGVYKSSTANLVEVAREVRKVLDEIEGEFRGRLNIHVYRDGSEEIIKSLKQLRNAGLIGGGLAIFFLFIFLRKFRSTIIISLAIPISMVATFAAMYLMRELTSSGITINIVSLMGLMMSVGMLVDNSVVVLESIFRHKQEEGLGPREAAIVGSSEVGTAVFAATLTTICVFLPMIFLTKSREGIWMKEFGLVVCVALICSLAIALTLVPLMASRIFTGKEKEKSKAITKLTDLYTSVIRRTLKHRWITLAAVVGLLWLSMYLFSHIEREFVPPVPGRNFRMDVAMPRGFRLEDAKKIFDDLERNILEKKDDLDVETIATRFGSRWGNIEIFLKSEEEGKLTALEAKDRVEKMLPNIVGVKFTAGRMRHMGGSEMGIDVQLKGPDEDVLAVLAEDFANLIKGMGGLEDVNTSLQSGEEEVKVTVRKERAEEYGLSPRQVATSMSSAIGGRSFSKFKTEDREIDIEVRLEESDELSLERLKNLTIEGKGGVLVPFSTVADFGFREGPRSIRREDRKTIVTVSANIKGFGIRSIGKRIEERLSGIAMPPGYTWELGESYQEMKESEKSSRFALILAAIMIYIIMASLFESFAHPFAIMFSIPFAFIGVGLCFYLTNTALSTFGYLGVIILCGIVVNNGIVLVDYINHLRRSGMPRYEAIVKGGRNRLRPILMTALTTIFGLLPMTAPMIFPKIFGPVEGGRSQMWAPVSLAILGGLTTSTFLTLIIMPTIYSLVDDLAAFLKKVISAV